MQGSKEYKKELLKWLNIDELQRVQDSFHEMTGMSAVTIDLEGNPITKKSGNDRYCDELVKNNKKACMLCRECHVYGANEAGKREKASIYYCHMGLLEFSSPIIIDGLTVACMVGGMLPESLPSLEELTEIAGDYDLDPELLMSALKEKHTSDIFSIMKASDFMYTMALIISNAANGRLNTERSNEEMLKASSLKDDFLANMSHEIRTPMNAVIGMAEIALKEDMSAEAYEHVKEIQSSGKALLRIINDILDYSKINSGKLDIFPEEYSLPELISNVNSIISNRLLPKKDSVSLLVDVDPTIPEHLIGDSSRIQQIIINLANNAVKFTESGSVRIVISHQRQNEKNTILNVSVEDTGIGIKSEDLGRLFQSFTQVNSKRNRSIEGTGLGLAIVKQLTELMGGNVSVSSKFGVGSVFSFSIPQEVPSNTPCAFVENAKNIAILNMAKPTLRSEHLVHVSDMLGISCAFLEFDSDALEKLMHWIRDNSSLECFLLVEEDKDMESDDIEFLEGLMNENRNLHVCLITGEERPAILKDHTKIETIKAPIYTINLKNLIYNCLNKAQGITPDIDSISTPSEVHFMVHGASVLLVDDTPINLRVAEKLLERVGIKPDKAISGKQAIEKITSSHYDLVFMDHMMPELDGIDTTRIIRRFHTKYDNMPIIALTANVAGEAKQLFLDEGMNDFLAKPIEVRDLNAILLKWLPKKCIEIIP